MKNILLVNLGSPKSYKPLDVWRYLTEFLTDPRVIEAPFWKRQLLVRGIIVPFRFRESAKNYQKVWTKEGSLLIAQGEKVRSLLEKELSIPVHLAMRYGEPSIKKTLKGIKGEVVVVPLFPQYAEATSGSIVAEVKKYRRDASFVFLEPDHPTMIEAMAAQVNRPLSKIAFEAESDDFSEGPVPAESTYPEGHRRFRREPDPSEKARIPSEMEFRKRSNHEFDHLLMSFHGLPVKQDRHGYKEACYRTAKALGEKLQKPYSVSFQSRLGKEPWLEPYTNEVLTQIPGRVAVVSPSFVADCLETIYELGMEYRSLFEGPVIPCMNDHPLWIKSLKEQISEAL